MRIPIGINGRGNVNGCLNVKRLKYTDQQMQITNIWCSGMVTAPKKIRGNLTTI